MRLWIFAVQSYGAMSSFDGGDTDLDFDQEPVIVGHQYAETREAAIDAMAEQLIDEHLDIEKPDYYDKDDPTELESQSILEWDKTFENVKDELQYFELIPDGAHTTMFLS